MGHGAREGAGAGAGGTGGGWSRGRGHGRGMEQWQGPHWGGQRLGELRPCTLIVIKLLVRSVTSKCFVPLVLRDECDNVCHRPLAVY